MKKYLQIIVFVLTSLVFSPGISTDAVGQEMPEQKKVITIGSEPNYPPYCIVDDKGNPDGFSVELFIAAADAVGLEVRIKIGVWSIIQQDLAKGWLDALPLVGRTPEREKLFDFTMPYMSLHGAVFVRKGTKDIESLADLYGKEILVMKGDNAEEFARREKISDEIITTNTFEEAFQKLANGKHDAVITQRVMGIELLKSMGLKRIIPLDFQIPKFRQDFCFAVQEGDEELLHRLNEGLSIIIANDTYKKIRTKWFGPAIKGKITFQDILKVALYFIIPLVAFGSFLWIIFLRITVKKRTQSILEEITRHKKTQELLEYKINELTVIHNATKILQKLWSIEQLSRKIIKILTNNFHYKYGAILLIEKNSNRLIPFALGDPVEGQKNFDKTRKKIASYDLRIGRGITGWVAEKGISQKIDDVRKDDRYIRVREDIRSELCVPLKVGNKIIGVINIESDAHAAYSESDLVFLETLSASMAIAIENVRLFNNLQKEIKQHKITESELLKLKSELEIKVEERTKQLKEKITELDRSQKAMLYMVEDLNKITRNLKIERQKLKFANKDLESFSYSVSHDLRAPLRHINGYIKLLVDQYNEILTGKGKHYLEVIQDSANHMGALIDDLLEFFRTGRKALKKIKVDMNALVKEVTNMLETDRKERNIKWIIDDLPTVYGDPSLLKIVWLNLIENALKYSIQSSPSIIEIHGSEDDRENKFEVKDNGVGFDMTYYNKLFGVFERLHSASDYKGTGIGLATVRKIITRHGGRIWADAKVDEGASFFFTIPEIKGE